MVRDPVIAFQAQSVLEATEQTLRNPDFLSWDRTGGECDAFSIGMNAQSHQPHSWHRQSSTLRATSLQRDVPQFESLGLIHDPTEDQAVAVRSPIQCRKAFWGFHPEQFPWFATGGWHDPDSATWAGRTSRDNVVSSATEKGDRATIGRHGERLKWMWHIRVESQLSVLTCL